MTLERGRTGIDDYTIQLIAERVAAMLRDELQAIAAELGTVTRSEPPLSVDDVAERFGIARSTVYTHWREWGGYKLGQGDRAAIRFPRDALPEHAQRASDDTQLVKAKGKKPRRRGRGVLRGAPRLPLELGDDLPKLETQGSHSTCPDR